MKSSASEPGLSEVSEGTVIYELNFMRKILCLSFFYAEIDQIRKEELYK